MMHHNIKTKKAFSEAIFLTKEKRGGEARGGSSPP
jgi:hypothetical protein